DSRSAIPPATRGAGRRVVLRRRCPGSAAVFGGAIGALVPLEAHCRGHRWTQGAGSTSAGLGDMEACCVLRVASSNDGRGPSALSSQLSTLLLPTLGHAPPRGETPPRRHD